MWAKNILMKSRFFLLLTILLLTACAPQVAATSIPASAPSATAAPDKPITLRMAVSDAEGRPSEPYVLEFIEQVKTLSDGNISIEPTWDAGAEITPFFEQGVVKVVKDGQFELGLAGSRAWDGMGVTSFQALQAPFLITNDALAEAVASSDIARQMLDSLPSAGIAGLALWPEDLRHPFSMDPDKPILLPDDFQGLSVRAIPSEVSYMLIKTLGGSPMYGDDYQAVESGLRQGASLNGTPTATGNVIFFPKFQVLFANGAALEKLSEGQRAILREAAAATQKKAIVEHPTEADAAAAWCADGGTVVMASDEQIAAFEAAAKPVFDKIEQDPLNAELIAAIRKLKAETTPAPGAQACESQIAQSSAVSESEKVVWSTGLPPNGKWTVNLTTEDVIAKGVRPSKATEWSGQFFFEFQDGQGLFRGEYLDGFIAQCPFTYEAVDDFFRNTYVDLGQPNYDCGTEVDDLQWRLDEKGQLFLHVIDIKGAPLIENKAVYEAKPWQKAVNP
jgi:TRAP-type C4-dicarboxylate transport system substrate-binding protein